MFRLPGFSPLLFTLFFACAAPCAFPQTGAGSLDPDYAPMLTADGDFSLAAQAPGGKFVVAGKFDFIAGAPRRSLARLSADGSVEAFAPPQLPGSNFTPLSLAALDDGRVAACYGSPDTLILGGSAGDGSWLRVFAADGALESEIVASSVTNGSATTATAVTRVAGRGNVVYFAKATTFHLLLSPSPNSFSRSTTIEAIGLAGAVAVKPVFNGAVTGLLPLADGAVLVWGNFSQVSSATAGSSARPGLARLNADLSLDAWVPSGVPEGAVVSAAAGPGGTMYVATLAGTS